MKRIAFASMLAGAATGPAGAGCPGHVASLPGVQLSRSEPFLARLYRQTPEGLTEVPVLDREGTLEEVLTLYAHPLADVRRISVGGTLDLDYGTDPAGLEGLEDIKLWQSTVVLLVNGKPVLEGQVENRLSGTETVAIGDCETEVWLVEHRLEMGDGDGSWTLLSYAPALGLVVRLVKMSATGEPLNTVAFDRIEVVAD